MRTRALIQYSLAGFVGLAVTLPAFSANLPIDSALDGVNSKYTSLISKIAKSAMTSNVESDPNNRDVLLRCWETPETNTYIGLEQLMTINAPLQTVAAVLDDFEHYQELFPEFKEIKVLSHQNNLYETYWEQRVPLFFVPNVKYEMLYLIDNSLTDRRIYRYQLKRKSTLESSDGFIVIQKMGDSKTAYREVDFVDADWGPAKILGKTKIWNESVEGIYISDLAVKLKAENPEWTHKNALNEARKLKKDETYESCVKSRKPLPADFGS